MPNVIDENIINEIKELISIARQNVARQVNDELLKTYWNIGRIIVNYEQKGNIKAEYGRELISNLSKEITKELGKGFSRSNLKNMRTFYFTYQKSQTLSGELS